MRVSASENYRDFIGCFLAIRERIMVQGKDIFDNKR